MMSMPSWLLLFFTFLSPLKCYFLPKFPRYHLISLLRLWCPSSWPGTQGACPATPASRHRSSCSVSWPCSYKWWHFQPKYQNTTFVSFSIFPRSSGRSTPSLTPVSLGPNLVQLASGRCCWAYSHTESSSSALITSLLFHLKLELQTADTQQMSAALN